MIIKPIVRHESDPTHTSDLRARFAASFAARWGRVESQVSAAYRAGLAGKHALWRRLGDAMEEEIIGGGDWMKKYIGQGYKRGTIQAQVDTRVARIPLPPVSALQLQIQQETARASIGERAAARVSGAREINTAVLNAVGEIPDELWGTGEYMDRAKNRIQKIGVTRSRALAATAIVDIFAIGTLDRLAGWGFRRVSIIPEVIFTTAGDSRVCPLCKEIEGANYDVFTARGVIPRHPYCRCRWTLDVGFLIGQAVALGLIEDPEYVPAS